MSRPGDGGFTLVWVAILLLALFGVAAIVVDLGNGRDHKTALQSASDAAALAGSQELPSDTTGAIATAAEYAFTNLGLGMAPAGAPCADDPAARCYATGQHTVRVTSPYAPPSASGDPASYIRVQTCEQVPTSFARVIGINSMEVCGQSTALQETASAGECALCILGETGTTLSSTGAGRLETINGGIVVNSNDPQAVSITNSAGRIVAGPAPPEVFGINGGYSASDPLNLQPSPTTGYTPVPDPLAGLAVPSVPGPIHGSVSVSGSTSVTLSPGIYTKITSSSSGTITLQPGIYVITGEIKLAKSPAAGETSLFGDDVMLYFACSSYPVLCAAGEGGARFASSGGATVDLSGRASTDPDFAGMVIYFDRNNTSELSLTGSSATSVDGTIYLKSGTVSLTGPSGVSTFSAAIVANDVKKTGDSAIVLDFDPTKNHAALSGSGDGGLVE
jgi:hypothetical protein